MKPRLSSVKILSPSNTPPPLEYKEKFNVKFNQYNYPFKGKRIPKKNISNKNNASGEAHNSFAPVYSLPNRSNQRRHSVADVNCETDKKEGFKKSNILTLREK